MNNKVPTAEEFINTHYYSEQQMMIEFAKLHVKAALEAASGRVVFKEVITITNHETPPYMRRKVDTVIDKDLILNAYQMKILNNNYYERIK